ncbi:MAG: hypothetical protein K2N14_02145 [Clostridia bacterium]|nr:hypothetical protein [Clostridia bacterium]
MNTAKYNKYDLQDTQALLNKTDNAVRPTEYYLAVESFLRQNEETEPSKSGVIAPDESALKKLNTLLSRGLTVVARENGELCGIASMDKQGNLGLLCVIGDEFKKTAKLLIRALERRGGKKQVAGISVTPTEDCAKIFKECGYSLCGETDVFVKQLVEEKEPVNFPPEYAKRIILDGKKPIIVEGFDMVFPIIFFGIACFFAVLLTVLGIAYKNGSANVYGGENIPLFAIIIGILFFIGLGLIIAYTVRGKSIKKRVLAGYVTNAVITDLAFDEYWTYERTDDGGSSERHVRVSLTYVFYDEQLVLHTGRFVSKYQSRAPQFYYGQEVVIAYVDGESYILRTYTILKEESVVEKTESGI